MKAPEKGAKQPSKVLDRPAIVVSAKRGTVPARTSEEGEKGKRSSLNGKSHDTILRKGGVPPFSFPVRARFFGTREGPAF